MQLSEIPSPQLGPYPPGTRTPFDPIAFEDDYDMRMRNENPGADDSESDGEMDDENPVGPDDDDRQIQLEDNKAAVGTEAEFGFVKEEKEEPVEPVLYGAPLDLRSTLVWASQSKVNRLI